MPSRTRARERPKSRTEPSRALPTAPQGRAVPSSSIAAAHAESDLRACRRGPAACPARRNSSGARPQQRAPLGDRHLRLEADAEQPGQPAERVVGQRVGVEQRRAAGR